MSDISWSEENEYDAMAGCLKLIEFGLGAVFGIAFIAAFQYPNWQSAVINTGVVWIGAVFLIIFMSRRVIERGE
jgi:hypothetical protein